MTHEALRRLADLYGIENHYLDTAGVRRTASPEALLAILPRLGAEVSGEADVEDAIRACERERWAAKAPKVAVAFGGELRLPVCFREGYDSSYEVTLCTEDGVITRAHGSLEDATVASWAEVDGTRYLRGALPLASRLPAGYHRLTFRLDGSEHETLVLSAPPRMWRPCGAGTREHGHPKRSWGVFAPVYGLRSAESLGVGDLRELEQLIAEVYRRGGRVVGTLPLLAAFLEGRVESSPYMPVSRLYWNELYLDVRALPELSASPEARAMLGSPAFAREVAALEADRYADPERAMALRRPILERLADRFFDDEASRGSLGARLEEDPLLDPYARFRAVMEARAERCAGATRPTREEGFRRWPERLARGDFREGDYAPSSYRYHVYVQLRMKEQLAALDAHARKGDGHGLYLDLPLGVHPDGFDAWRERELFAEGLEVGAPPDDFFSLGQRWGFPPTPPEAQRRNGYEHLRACLANHMRYAGMLRIDHVMALHRLFLIPNGMEAREGAYVRYPAEELYAVLGIESHRHETLLVGEDLGTVPPEVRRGMAAHGVDRMYVMDYELSPESTSEPSPREPIPHASVASLDTHDMPMFAAFVSGDDIAMGKKHGHFDEARAEEALAARRLVIERLWARASEAERCAGATRPIQDDGAPLDRGALLRFLLEELARSPARVVLITLEDLWLEPLPQNVPGTGWEEKNFRRRLAHRVPELFDRSDVIAALDAVDRARCALATRPIPKEGP